MQIQPASSVVGHISVPGDKSISHRAVLLASVSEGETRIDGFGRSGDTESTLRAMRELGVEIGEDDVDTIRVQGVGLRGLRAPEEPVDCGNAGTLLRLLTGLAAGQEGPITLTGDESLRTRPMERVAEPLRRMGARVETTDGGAPVTVAGGSLRGIDYELPVASAQVKSAVLLAGLYAEGRTTVVEPIPTRDHTELLLEAAGARLTRRPKSASVTRAERLRLGEVTIPGDFSAAAPFVVAATLLAGSELHVHGIGLNPRRTGLLDVLERMGARITAYNRRRIGREPAGDLDVRSAELVATEIVPEEVPRLVDELPLFALAASCARGTSRVRGAGELALKESDRIETLAAALRGIGARVRARPDGFQITGVPTRPRGGTIDASGDHRIAILGAIAGVVSREGTTIRSAEAAAISFPGFFDLLDSVTHR